VYFIIISIIIIYIHACVMCHLAWFEFLSLAHKQNKIYICSLQLYAGEYKNIYIKNLKTVLRASLSSLSEIRFQCRLALLDLRDVFVVCFDFSLPYKVQRLKPPSLKKIASKHLSVLEGSHDAASECRR
jgi:hypothetical protein